MCEDQRGVVYRSAQAQHLLALHGIDAHISMCITDADVCKPGEDPGKHRHQTCFGVDVVNPDLKGIDINVQAARAYECLRGRELVFSPINSPDHKTITVIFEGDSYELTE